MRHTARHLPLYREKARERRHPAREGEQGIGGDGLHDEDEDRRVGRPGQEERQTKMRPEGLGGVVDKAQIHGRSMRCDQRAGFWAAGRRKRPITTLIYGARRPGGPKRLDRNSTHEERPAGPRGRLSREAGAHLRHCIYWPSGR